MPEKEQAWDLGILRIKGLRGTPSWGWPVSSGYRRSHERGIDEVGSHSWGKMLELTQEQNE